jgi:hypothetical protein
MIDRSHACKLRLEESVGQIRDESIRLKVKAEAQSHSPQTDADFFGTTTKEHPIQLLSLDHPDFKSLHEIDRPNNKFIQACDGLKVHLVSQKGETSISEVAVASLFGELGEISKANMMTGRPLRNLLRRRLAEVGGKRTLGNRKPDVLGHPSKSDIMLATPGYHAFLGELKSPSKPIDTDSVLGQALSFAVTLLDMDRARKFAYVFVCNSEKFELLKVDRPDVGLT